LTESGKAEGLQQLIAFVVLYRLPQMMSVIDQSDDVIKGERFVIMKDLDFDILRFKGSFRYSRK
jgi:hypothetical protein